MTDFPQKKLQNWNGRHRMRASLSTGITVRDARELSACAFLIYVPIAQGLEIQYYQCSAIAEKPVLYQAVERMRQLCECVFDMQIRAHSSMQTVHESGAQTSPCSDNECSSELRLGTRRVRASQGPYVLIQNHSTGVQWQVLGSVNINVSNFNGGNNDVPNKVTCSRDAWRPQSGRSLYESNVRPLISHHQAPPAAIRASRTSKS
jgi:hypothetical protein